MHGAEDVYEITEGESKLAEGEIINRAYGEDFRAGAGEKGGVVAAE